jgi:hypothetical protein
MQASRPNVPTTLERDTVLAAAKDASRRLRRWPAAILDGACARRHSIRARSGRRNGLGQTKKLHQSEPNLSGISPVQHVDNQPGRTSASLSGEDRQLSYVQTRGPSPGAQERADLSPACGPKSGRDSERDPRL